MVLLSVSDPDADAPAGFICGRERRSDALGLIREFADRLDAFAQRFTARQAPAGRSVGSRRLIDLFVGLGEKGHRGVWLSCVFAHGERASFIGMGKEPASGMPGAPFGPALRRTRISSDFTSSPGASPRAVRPEARTKNERTNPGRSRTGVPRIAHEKPQDGRAAS